MNRTEILLSLFSFALLFLLSFHFAPVYFFFFYTTITRALCALWIESCPTYKHISTYAHTHIRLLCFVCEGWSLFRFVKSVYGKKSLFFAVFYLWPLNMTFHAASVASLNAAGISKNIFFSKKSITFGTKSRKTSPSDELMIRNIYATLEFFVGVIRVAPPSGQY